MNAPRALARWIALGLAASAQLLAQAQTLPNIDQCLLEQAKLAPADTKVGELRQLCEARAAKADIEPRGLKPPPRFAERLLNTPPEELSLFEQRVVSELRAGREAFALVPHRPNFLLPLSYQRGENRTAERRNAHKSLETVFQISFKFPLSAPLFDGAVFPFFAYTGRSWWQVYDGARSRPFREYNHEPELLLALPGTRASLFGWAHRATAVGFNHQSNGRTVPESRSWNRLTAEAYFDRGRHDWAALKVWQRIGEDRKTDPTDPSGDDNPDITRYMGHFELKLGHVGDSGHNLTATVRRSLRSDGRGALQLDWSHPHAFSPALRWKGQLFSGYGDSLIDYNVKVNRVSVGVMLNDWF